MDREREGEREMSRDRERGKRGRHGHLWLFHISFFYTSNPATHTGVPPILGLVYGGKEATAFLDARILSGFRDIYLLLDCSLGLSVLVCQS